MTPFFCDFIVVRDNEENLQLLLSTLYCTNSDVALGCLLATRFWPAYTTWVAFKNSTMRRSCGASAAAVVCCSFSPSSSLRLQSSSSFDNLKHHIAGKKRVGPLSPPSPSIRNIAIPDSVHARRGTKDVLTAEALKKRALKALAQKMKQDVLWEGAVVSDSAHHVAQHILNLRTNGKYRRSRQMLIAGGESFIRELCQAGHRPRHIIVSSKNDVPDWAHGMAKDGVVVMSRAVLDEVAPGTDGFLADFDAPAPPPTEELIANKHKMERVLVLDNVADPGQLGTMLRTAAGFSYDAIILVNHCADLHDPKVVAAARGAQFQSAVPIYQLREEDGDDAMAMIRHITARNSLEPLCFSPHNGGLGSDTTECEASSSPPVPKAVAQPHVKPSTAHTAQSLTSFCVETFSRPSTSTLGGHILFAGPDYKHNLVQRARAATAHVASKPLVTLTMDEEPTTALLAKSGTDVASSVSGAHPAEFVASLSCVLYALRPSGQWDYLSDEQRTSTVADSTLNHKMKVDFGADRPTPVSPQDLNLTREEQVAAGHYLNEKRKSRRLRERQRTDYSFWMVAEAKRIREMATREANQAASPWKEQRPAKHVGANGLPDHVPNIINDYRQPLDRDVLREEREDAQNYVRPPNYDHRIVPGGRHSANPRKVPTKL